MSLTALDPQQCTRCRRLITAEDPDRPESLTSHFYSPVQPRPVMPGGIRADGTVVEPIEVHWQVAADYEHAGSIAALLCQPCTEQLRDWLYLSPGSAQTVRQHHDASR